VAEDPSWFLDAGPEVFESLGRIIGSQDDVLQALELLDVARTPSGTLFLAFRA
jgi:hypothetical protein